MRRRTRGMMIAAMVFFAALITIGAQSAPIAPTIHLTSATAAGARVDLAARESIERYAEWLGPPPASLLVEEDRSWRLPHAAMNIETHVAYELARQWFAPHATAPVVPGIAWFLQGRVVERLFDYAYHQLGHSAEAAWFFGDTWPREFPLLRMSRWTAGLGRYDAHARWPRLDEARPPTVDAEAIRTAKSLAVTEQAVGWPALQGALFEVRRHAQSAEVTRPSLIRIISDATGRNVAPLFEWVEHAAGVDYAIASVTTEPCERASCVRTTVAVESNGLRAPQPIALRVVFGDGQHVDTPWDGTRRSFQFESSTPAVSAHLDLDRVLIVDADLLDNNWYAAPVTNVPTGKWTSRWLVWMQDAMLAYSAGL